jgi:hypothetical protein
MSNKENGGVVDSISVKCDCFTHSLELVRLEETYDKGPTFKSFELSVWQLANHVRPMGWRERFRWVWRILRTGNPWTDMIILSDDKAKEIAQFITKHTS